jgi:hypothetical protein
MRTYWNSFNRFRSMAFYMNDEQAADVSHSQFETEVGSKGAQLSGGQKRECG